MQGKRDLQMPTRPLANMWQPAIMCREWEGHLCVPAQSISDTLGGFHLLREQAGQ